MCSSARQPRALRRASGRASCSLCHPFRVDRSGPPRHCHKPRRHRPGCRSHTRRRFTWGHTAFQGPPFLPRPPIRYTSCFSPATQLFPSPTLHHGSLYTCANCGHTALPGPVASPPGNPAHRRRRCQIAEGRPEPTGCLALRRRRHRRHRFQTEQLNPILGSAEQHRARRDRPGVSDVVGWHAPDQTQTLTARTKEPLLHGRGGVQFLFSTLSLLRDRFRRCAAHADEKLFRRGASRQRLPEVRSDIQCRSNTGRVGRAVNVRVGWAVLVCERRYAVRCAAGRSSATWSKGEVAAQAIGGVACRRLARLVDMTFAPRTSVHRTSLHSRKAQAGLWRDEDAKPPPREWRAVPAYQGRTLVTRGCSLLRSRWVDFVHKHRRYNWRLGLQAGECPGGGQQARVGMGARGTKARQDPPARACHAPFVPAGRLGPVGRLEPRQQTQGMRRRGVELRRRVWQPYAGHPGTAPGFHLGRKVGEGRLWAAQPRSRPGLWRGRVSPAGRAAPVVGFRVPPVSSWAAGRDAGECIRWGAAARNNELAPPAQSRHQQALELGVGGRLHPLGQHKSIGQGAAV
eukprot:scaffold11295_cov120-Isochrysis_galbana.AAC.3